MTLPWITRAPNMPYFMDDTGAAWTPIGQNDAVCWEELNGLIGRRDLPAVRRYLAKLSDHGVTCLRLMLEYAETDDFYFEQPAGQFNPVMVQLWDDLFTEVERAGLRVLLTPMDTFFQWVRWDQHPYNAVNGGPCATRTQLMTCPDTRALIKARLGFAARRWSGSGALFAWDLWNEMHPVQGEDRMDCFADYIDDVSPFLRELETSLFGKAHLQCVSVFGPELHWKPWLNEPVFRHRLLDFASTHLYAEGTIDYPSDTVTPALAVGELMAEALAEITDQRPVFDSEHGPIHLFKDHGVTLSEAFDDEYFRHIQWVHLASGGAGGGMRWPNRRPHRLTDGMRQSQHSLAGFARLIDWTRFDRRPSAGRVSCSDSNIYVVACGDAEQLVIYLLRKSPLNATGQVDATITSSCSVRLNFENGGEHQVSVWNTSAGEIAETLSVVADGHQLIVPISNLRVDAAIWVKRS